MAKSQLNQGNNQQDYDPKLAGDGELKGGNTKETGAHGIFSELPTVLLCSSKQPPALWTSVRDLCDPL